MQTKSFTAFAISAVLTFAWIGCGSDSSSFEADPSVTESEKEIITEQLFEERLAKRLGETSSSFGANHPVSKAPRVQLPDL